ncbi:hypothetical protein GF359_01810 [candidate division WOR-3 bacterium]|uniref:TPM domain-containing protein n=1 Tax=candidate division WOR-3 bacterium TaxID=2052148 RepID=A0A9D5QBX8_UNCW3|nr:hypothetical protein [candidate division WOR-3 bacterium]MBD3363929.1 hypothetical protein [candidate division WOR-3 bacterium]
MRKCQNMLGAVIIILAAAGPSCAKYPRPPKGSYVRDDANIITDHYEEKINLLCREVEDKTTAQMAVLTIRTFGDKEPWRYAIEIGNRWGVGQADTDNGLVMVIAVYDRQYFTATGYGMEQIIPDSTLDTIQKETLVPYFSKTEYGEGILQTLQLLAVEIGKFYEDHTQQEIENILNSRVRDE